MAQFSVKRVYLTAHIWYTTFVKAFLLPLILAVSLVGCAPKKPQSPNVGKPAPDFTVAKAGTSDTEKLKLSDLKGKVVLIDFWATWCGPCLAIAPTVESKFKEYKSKGFEVLAVSSEEDVVLSTFAKNNNPPYPFYRDFAGMANGAYKVQGIPHQVIVDREGNIAFEMIGADSDALAKAIDEAMN